MESTALTSPNEILESLDFIKDSYTAHQKLESSFMASEKSQNRHPKPFSPLKANQTNERGMLVAKMSHMGHVSFDSFSKEEIKVVTQSTGWARDLKVLDKKNRYDLIKIQSFTI